MNERRIVLYGLPPLMSDIVCDILAGRPGVELVADVAAGGDLHAAVKEHGASHVVSRLEGSRFPKACDELVEDRACLHVIGLSDGGDDGWVYRLRAELSTLGSFSTDGFLAALELEAGA